MGPVGDEDNRNNVSPAKNNSDPDLVNDATQRIDSQFCSGGCLDGDGADDYRYLTSTMPVDDTYLMENDFETQLANFGGETQVIDLAGETQVLDDLDGMGNMCFDFLNEFDTEVAAAVSEDGPNETEALRETQELSQDESMVECGDQDGKGTVEISSAERGDKVSLEPPVICSSEKQNSGSVCRGFTSIRAASIRAFGLAARARGANKNLCSTSSDKSSIEEQTVEQGGVCLQNKCNEIGDEQRNANKCKVGRTAVRKLFMDDKDDEASESEADFDHTDDNLDTPAENCLAGLSYCDSQEPGELSQVNALKVVDNILELNFMEYGEAFDSRVHIAEKPKAVSGAKGSRDLAKCSIFRNKDGDHGVYDWDDTREDEGGGDFLQKKKELFFDNKEGPKKRSLTEPRKRRRRDLGNIKEVGEHGDEKDRTSNKDKFGDFIYSDSRLLVHKLRAKGNSASVGAEVFSKNLTKDLDGEATEHKLADNASSNDIPHMENIGPDTQMAAEAMENLCFEVQLAENDFDGPSKCSRSTGKATRKNKSSNKTAHLEEHSAPKIPFPASIGVVTRQRKQINAQKAVDDYGDAGTEINDLISSRVHRKRRTAVKNKSAEISKVRKVGSDGLKQTHETCVGTTSAPESVKRKRTPQETLSVAHESEAQCNTRLTRSKRVAASVSLNPEKNLTSMGSAPILASSDPQSKNALLERTVYNKISGSNVYDSDHVSVKSGLNSVGNPTRSKQCNKRSDAEMISAEGAGISGSLEASPGERHRTSVSGGTTPTTLSTPVNNVSPICMGDEYHRQSCRKNGTRFSLIKEINDLVTSSPGQHGGSKELRKRKDITNIRALFSQHLDVDVIKQQKKIVARLGGSVASSMSDATHFVADEFVRTRNMLEAIAFGKPVVTHLWLESCAQASCLIDEKNYILRDARKEKEFGFCLPLSLSRACQHPLLQGQKVLVTPNTKPGKDILANLVKAVHGLAVERLGRSALKDDKLPDDLLILSCEEDYDICVPFLEKGCAVYSSELLLNGIVTQKLEYERHRIFSDHVKRTRSTIWVKKKNQYLPVTKTK